MSELTPQQVAFLRSHRIPMSSVFDASGMRTTDYQSAMKAEGKSFAYGVTPCRAEGHTLRSRAGHCIQCDHAKIAYMLRHDARAYVYIAASAAGRLIKVGSAIDLADRTDKLNRYKYGGQADWQTLASVNSPSAGRIECEVHSTLARYAVRGDYLRAGKRQQCYELFRCNFSDAHDALRLALGSSGSIRVPDLERAIAAFRFRT